MLVFINVPYRMVDANIGRAANLSIGVEIYLDNHLIEEMDRNHVKELGRKLNGQGVPCTVHAPFMDLNPGAFDRTIRNVTQDKLKRAVEAANLLDAKTCVCHPGYDKWRFDGNEQLWLDGSIETWAKVLGEAKDGLPIVVENIFEDTPSTLITLFDYFENKDLWYCFDAGHFNLFSTVPLDVWLEPLRHRLREVHLHDNHGKSDEHLPIGSGTFPFRELRRLINQIQTQQIVFTVEPHSEATVIESIKRLKEFLT